MAIKFGASAKFGTAKTLVILNFIKKHWYLFVVFFTILPAIITSIQTAVETKNPTYPFFQLSLRLITADNVLEKDIYLLQNNPEEIVGMVKPSAGIWKNVVYYWKFFFNVIWKIIGNVFLIFFPLVLIYKIIRYRNISEPAKNLTKATWIFLLYLFITNTIIFIHGLVVGNTIIILPEGFDTFGEYFLLFKYVLPFHGLFSLFRYLIMLAIA